MERFLDKKRGDRWNGRPLWGKNALLGGGEVCFFIGGNLGDSVLDFLQNGEIVAVGVAAVVDDEIVEVGLGLIAVKAGVMDDNLDQRLILVLERDSLVGFGEAGLAVLGAVTLFGGLRLGVGLGLLLSQHQAALETGDIQNVDAIVAQLAKQITDRLEVFLAALLVEGDDLFDGGTVIVDQRLLVEIATSDVKAMAGEPGAILSMGGLNGAVPKREAELIELGINSISVGRLISGGLIGQVVLIVHTFASL